MSVSVSQDPNPRTLSPLPDPALTARTFSNNPTLHAALQRIASGARKNTPVPLAVVANGASNETVICPLCGKWARQEGARFYHVELKDLETGVRDDARSVYCINTGAEVPDGGSDAQDNRAPTPRELDAQYLTLRGWEPRGDKWYDAVMDMTVPLAYALGMQDARDFRDALN